MNKVLIIFLTYFTFLQLSYGQANRKLSIYLQGHYHKTQYDITRGNNPSGLGLGVQLFYSPSARFRLTGEISRSAYLFGTKELRVYSNGELIPAVNSMINVLAGGAYYLIDAVSLSLTAGPSFLSGDQQQTRFGIKPAVNFYFPKNSRWIVGLSYMNVFNRDRVTNQDFGSIGFSIGIRLY